MARPRTPPSSRLSVDDWIQAGYAILAEEGHQGAENRSALRTPGRGQGSFYWHFTDMAAYRAGLVQSWGELRDEDRRHFDEISDIAPRERLSRIDIVGQPPAA